MTYELISIGLVCICFFLMINLRLFFKKNRQKQEQLIEVLENILLGKQNDYSCNQDTEMSQVYHLLSKIEYNCQLLLEQAHEEKEGIKYMISDLSHQLKTPLSNTKLYESLLDDDSLSLENRAKFHIKLKKQIDILEWILCSIIQCTRLEEGAIDFEAQMLPVNRTVTLAIENVLYKANQKNIDIIAEDELEGIHLFHNIKWTREVFINLLENAIKYSPYNSIIKIACEKRDHYTSISVTDEGIGIRKEEYNKIFQRFYRSKDVENADGFGIGLYLCRLILEKENGNITVSSRYGRGSTFSVYLLNNVP